MAARVDQRFAFTAMASRCELRLLAPDPATAERWAASAIAEVRRIEHKFSRYRDDSVIARINAAAGGDAVACDGETNALLDYANTLFHLSDGRFDASAGVLRSAWDFKRPHLPEPAQLSEALALVGWRRVERGDGQVRLPLRGMELDFGGFGKEYAADRAAAVLRAAGASAGYVNLGGDLHALGPRDDGRPWLIGIQDPRDARGIVAEIELSSGGLATSGDYERYFELNGRRYCHILDPRSGWPVRHWRSVSVTAPLCIAAGSCSTLTMLAEGAGLRHLRQSGLDYLAIDSDGHHHHHAKA